MWSVLCILTSNVGCTSTNYVQLSEMCVLPVVVLVVPSTRWLSCDVRWRQMCWWWRRRRREKKSKKEENKRKKKILYQYSVQTMETAKRDIPKPIIKTRCSLWTPSRNILQNTDRKYKYNKKKDSCTPDNLPFCHFPLLSIQADMYSHCNTEYSINQGVPARHAACGNKADGSKGISSNKR